MNRLFAAFGNLLRRRKRDQLVSDELQSCLELLEDEKRRQGMNDSEARRQARLELPVEQVRMQTLEAKMGSTVDALYQDIRYGIRSLSKAKGWTGVVVLTLALGIGANTLMFSLVNGLLLRSLPVPHPETLVRLRWSGPPDFTGITDGAAFTNSETGRPLRSKFSRIIFDQLRQDRRTVADMFACTRQEVIVFANGESEWQEGLIATGNYYEVLGAKALLGRTFTPEDDKPGAAPVVVLSFDYWSNRFSADPKVVGTQIRLNDLPVTIIGVMPRTFIGAQSLAETDKSITLPLQMSVSVNHQSGANQVFIDSAWNLQIMGRLVPGLTRAQANAELNAPFQAAAQQSWQTRLSAVPAAQRSLSQYQNRTTAPDLLVEAGDRGLFDTDAQSLRAGAILTIVVALLLLIVCANVANLMLSRATARRNEISIRLSIGATRGRLIRQLLTESMMLAATGAVLGLVINHWGRTIVPNLRSTLVSNDQIVVNFAALPELDWRILTFVIALTIGCAMVFGLAPALRGIKETIRTVSARRSFLNKSLVITQVALSLTLLIGAGLFLRSVQNLKNVVLGFNPHHVLTFHLSFRALGNVNTNEVGRILDGIAEKAEALGGVESVGGTSAAYWQSQITGSRSVFRFARDGAIPLDLLGVTPSFFQTMQIPLVSGRLPNRTELPAVGQPSRVALISQAAAQRLFPGEDPIGQRVGLTPQNAGNMEVIGVVSDTRYGDVRSPVQPMIYTLGRQTSFVVRTASDPMLITPGIRNIVREIDPRVAITDFETAEELSDARIHTERLLAGFYAIFSALALLLAAIGLYGVMSYTVAQRTREIGIRMALGARQQDVLRLVIQESLTLVAIGVIAGLALALATNRIIANQLFALAPTDTATLTISTTFMIVVACIAAYLPARRAARIDPLIAFRSN